MADIIDTGGYEELKSLYGDDGKIDENKLMDWLATSKHIECDEKTSRSIKSKLRKRKIDKLNDIS